jgi:hypothetical protein
MALQKNLTLENNFDEQSMFPNAYIKVQSVNGNKERMTAVVVTHKEKNGFCLTSKSYNFVPDLNSNFIEQAYNHLKTLPEFSGAMDC